MILVVGATGALGGTIVRELRARGLDVRALVRPQSDRGGLKETGAELVEGDLKDRSSLDAACAGVATVITTANAVKRGGPDTIESVDVAGNRNLVDAAVAAGVQQFVFVSAYGSTLDSPVPLFQAKAATEQYVRASGMPYTILAPDAFMDEWVAMVVGGPVLQGQPVTLVAPAEHRHTFIAAADVVAYAAAVVGNPAALNRTIPLGGPAPLNWREVVAVFEGVVGHPVEMQVVPPGTPIPGMPEMITALLTGMEFYESPVEMTETSREFGVEPTSVEAFARQMLAREKAV